MSYESVLAADGFRLFAAARAFLGEYGGLSDESKGIAVDPGEALALVEPARIRGWQQRIGREVCPVGTAARRHQIVLIDTAGLLYTGFDEDLQRLGHDMASSLDALLASRPGERIPRRPHLSADVQRRLAVAGWHEDRCCDIASFVRVVQAIGMRVHPEAMSFLREFGGLEVSRCARGPGHGEGRLRFDPGLAMDLVDPLWVTEVWAPRSGVALCPVGLEERALEVILVDESGVIHGGMDEDLVCYGDVDGSGLDALVGRPTNPPA